MLMSKIGRDRAADLVGMVGHGVQEDLRRPAAMHEGRSDKRPGVQSAVQQHHGVGLLRWAAHVEPAGHAGAKSARLVAKTRIRMPPTATISHQRRDRRFMAAPRRSRADFLLKRGSPRGQRAGVVPFRPGINQFQPGIHESFTPSRLRHQLSARRFGIGQTSPAAPARRSAGPRTLSNTYRSRPLPNGLHATATVASGCSCQPIGQGVGLAPHAAGLGANRPGRRTPVCGACPIRLRHICSNDGTAPISTMRLSGGKSKRIFRSGRFGMPGGGVIERLEAVGAQLAPLKAVEVGLRRRRIPRHQAARPAVAG